MLTDLTIYNSIQNQNLQKQSYLLGSAMRALNPCSPARARCRKWVNRQQYTATELHTNQNKLRLVLHSSRIAPCFPASYQQMCND